MSVSPSQQAEFATPVIDWYRQHGRKTLPWQLDKTAYRVWLSEIMLQQTQVATVIPYYHAFLKSFPTIKVLADASIDKVLQHWQGLGYYARARNLHRAAQIMRDRHDAQFPLNIDQVMALPGIGRSTAGAILTFACAQSWPILDGNVKRVLARCFEVEGWYGQSRTLKRLWQLTEQLTPVAQTDDYNQAMMDLGAMVCLKSNPQCEICPITDYCQSWQHNSQASFPQKKPARSKPQKQTLMLLHRYQDCVLLYRRPPTGIWGGLWSLPEVGSKDDISAWQLGHLVCTRLPDQIKTNILRHQFTHYILDISLAVIDLDELPGKISDQQTMAFVANMELPNYGLPTPVRKLLAMEINSGSRAEMTVEL